jgi:hypothetical protein
VLLTSGARVFYEIVLVALGRPPDRELVVDLGHALSAATVAGVVFGYHWFLVLRADLAALRGVAQMGQAVAVIAGLDAAGVEHLEQFARTSLDGARTRIYWTDQAHIRETVAAAKEGGPERALM